MLGVQQPHCGSQLCITSVPRELPMPSSGFCITLHACGTYTYTQAHKNTYTHTHKISFKNVCEMKSIVPHYCVTLENEG